MHGFAFFGMLNVLIYFGVIFFIIYSVVTVIKAMKQKNEILKEIRDELRKNNNKSV
ncbi:hypothetical protein JNUCC42_00285 [Brevibacterium sp. JNUCC-42]|nr:hypothetical protein [Brevibacillus laterosporus]QOS99287.1 hypothetical protein JNUCC42_00285 [Brevibacterium sp. JNUCC-42]RAP17919.1 hypothetical protein C2W64_04522 [Brevibacillus laterosporus]